MKKWKIWSSIVLFSLALASCAWIEFTSYDNRWTFSSKINREREIVIVWKLTQIIEKFPILEMRHEYQNLGYDFMSFPLVEDVSASNQLGKQIDYSQAIQMEARRRPEYWVSNGVLHTYGCGVGAQGCVKPLKDVVPLPQVARRSEEAWLNAEKIIIPAFGSGGCTIPLPPNLARRDLRYNNAAIFIKRQIVYLLNLDSEKNVFYVSKKCGNFERVDYSDLLASNVDATHQCNSETWVLDVAPKENPNAPSLLLVCESRPETYAIFDLDSNRFQSIPRALYFVGENGKMLVLADLFDQRKSPEGKGFLVTIRLLNAETGATQRREYTYTPKIRKPVSQLGEFYQFLGM